MVATMRERGKRQSTSQTRMANSDAMVLRLLSPFLLLLKFDSLMSRSLFDSEEYRQRVKKTTRNMTTKGRSTSTFFAHTHHTHKRVAGASSKLGHHAHRHMENDRHDS